MSDRDYVFKVDTPWGKKGEKVSGELWVSGFDGWGNGKSVGLRFNYEDFPDLFEKVKSDEQEVKEFIEVSLTFEISPYVVSRLLRVCPDLADRIRRGK